MVCKKFLNLLLLIQIIVVLATAGQHTPHRRQKRIVHGIATTINEFPYQVSLRFTDSRKHFCGGAILSDRWILTAAQCTQGSKSLPHNIFVIVGATNLTNDGRRYDLEKIVNHPHFIWAKRQNDISMLKTKEPLQLIVTSVFPVDLPSFKLNYIIANGIGLTSAVLSGWGHSHGEGSAGRTVLSQMLRSQESYVLPHISCRGRIENVDGLLLNDGHLCTEPRTGEGMCIGDVGNPLVSKSGQLVGIASWRVSDCGNGLPNMYTRVFQHLKWIWSNLLD